MGLSAFNLHRRLDALKAAAALPVEPKGEPAKAPPVLSAYALKQLTCVKGCGFVAKNKKGLQQHKRYCSWAKKWQRGKKNANHKANP